VEAGIGTWEASLWDAQGAAMMAALRRGSDARLWMAVAYFW
jgi:hypothetical protein